MAIVIRLLRGEWSAVQEGTRTLRTIAGTQDFPMWLAHAAVLTGRALVAQGKTSEGLQQMRQGADALQAAGQTQGTVLIQCMLAEGYAHDGQIDTALTVLTEALDVVHTHGLRLWEPEVYRLRGEFLLAHQGNKGARTVGKRHEEATTCFQQALALARQQEARAWELRAALSLARLGRQSRQAQAARRVLAAVYEGFTEGFDTADLRAARALLCTCATGL